MVFGAGAVPGWHEKIISSFSEAGHRALGVTQEQAAQQGQRQL